MLPKLFLPTLRKNLKFEAEGQEFAKIQRSLEQFIETAKRSEQFLVTKCFFNLFLEVSHIQGIRTIRTQIEKKNVGI